MKTTSTINSVNIRPGVTMLSVLQHLNYKPWFAMAEFVDNSLQSALDYKAELQEVEGKDYRLRVKIEFDPAEPARLVIRDNAAGIHQADYARAFRPAAVPLSQDGLCEFGMGMKSAACWFADHWTVRTTALGEPVERTVEFDINSIVQDSLEELAVREREVPANSHYTEIVLSHLHKPPQGRTMGKIKEHLAGIYRMFIRDGFLTLAVDRDTLGYTEPAVLSAPYYKDLTGPAVEWRKEIDFDFGAGMRVRGFAALRETASTTHAGFALFRRHRVIQGSADDGYRPFGKPNSYTYQRLFGELELEGFEVSHTKDGFRWDENEEAFRDLLKEHLDSQPLSLLSQAEGHRARLKEQAADLKQAADLASKNTADAIESDVPPVLERQLEIPPKVEPPPEELEPARMLARRVISATLGESNWEIILELTDDPAVGNWVDSFDADHKGENSSVDSGLVRRLGVRLALAHPVMTRFCDPQYENLEPFLRIAAAIILAETSARDGGIRGAAAVRQNINELLRDAFSKP